MREETANLHIRCTFSSNGITFEKSSVWDSGGVAGYLKTLIVKFSKRNLNCLCSLIFPGGLVGILLHSHFPGENLPDQSFLYIGGNSLDNVEKIKVLS